MTHPHSNRSRRDRPTSIKLPEQTHPFDRNPVIQCSLCDSEHAYQDYWRARCVLGETHADDELYCDECLERMATLYDRLTENRRLSDFSGNAGETHE
jgi:hypothetical protein